jgi:hypothetical protein
MNWTSPVVDFGREILHAQAQRYRDDYEAEGFALLGDDDPGFPSAGDNIRARGFARLPEIFEIAYWKSPRKAHLVKNNPGAVVEAGTRLAFSLMKTAPVYAARSLDILDGVGIPTASAILTVADPQDFGIIDIRAWQALSRQCPSRFPWKEYSGFSSKDYRCYLETIRDLASANGLSSREVDMALWEIGGGEE